VICIRGSDLRSVRDTVDAASTQNGMGKDLAQGHAALDAAHVVESFGPQLGGIGKIMCSGAGNV
jgi:hypothetical protein